LDATAGMSHFDLKDIDWRSDLFLKSPDAPKAC
jgi:hypothetical protein